MTRGQANLPKSIMAMYAPMMLNQMIEGKAMAYKAREMGLKDLGPGAWRRHRK